MRVLHVSNFGGNLVKGHRCGISNFGVQTSAALRRVGCDVTDWDGAYDTIYAKVQVGEPAYLPDGAEAYDVIHFTWHPLAINHYGTGHWPTSAPATTLDFPSKSVFVRWKPLLSIYLTDLPPYSGCPCLDAFRFRVSAEDHECLGEEKLILPYPIVDWLDDLPPPADRFTVGWTGIRGDGLAILARACELRRWAFNASDPAVWLSIEEEAARLARSTVNVCWYWDQRNIAGAPSTCLSSRRPLLLNQSAMFNHLKPYADEIYFADSPDWDNGEQLDRMLDRVYRDWQAGQMKTPIRVYEDFGWTKSAERLVAAWEEARRC